MRKEVIDKINLGFVALLASFLYGIFTIEIRNGLDLTFVMGVIVLTLITIVFALVFDNIEKLSSYWVVGFFSIMIYNAIAILKGGYPVEMFVIVLPDLVAYPIVLIGSFAFSHLLIGSNEFLGMKQKKAQAAMEFLMTYGWAILVVLVAIGALAYFGVIDPFDRAENDLVLTRGVNYCVEWGDFRREELSWICQEEDRCSYEVVNTQLTIVSFDENGERLAGTYNCTKWIRASELVKDGK